MSNTPHKITLDLRWGGYTGTDIDELMSKVPGSHPIRCELESYPTCEGPNSYRIFVEIGTVLALAGKPFLGEFAKDLYKWSKGALGTVFRRKKSADGWAELRFKDKTIILDDYPASDEFADSWLALPDLLETEDLSGSDAWKVEVDPVTKKVTLKEARKR